MGVKRTGNINAGGMKDCLLCGTQLKDLKDDEIAKCHVCGQKHFVDLIGDTLTLTDFNRPELRKREERLRIYFANHETPELQALVLLQRLNDTLPNIKKHAKELKMYAEQIERETDKILKSAEKYKNGQ